MSLRRRVGSLASLNIGPAKKSMSSPSPVQVNAPVYPHATSHRSLQMELRVYSPAVRVIEDDTNKRTIPHYEEGDQLCGLVNLDPTCSQSGRIVVSIEGAFTYDHVGGESSRYGSDQKRHIFYSASSSFHVSSEIGLTMGSPTPPSSFRLPTIRRQTSTGSLRNHARSGSRADTGRSFPFNFDLPKGARSTEEIPRSFSLSGEHQSSASTDARIFAVDYKIAVSWEPFDESEYPSFLEVPFLYRCTDEGPSSHNKANPAINSWLEMPLRTDRSANFRCAVTLPTPMTFFRTSAVPFFVVFTTTPYDSDLVDEIASDATICVTVMRQMTVLEPTVLPPTPPDTPSSSEDADAHRSSRFMRAVKMPIKRSRSASLNDEWARHPSSPHGRVSMQRDKPLPRPPATQTFKESEVLYTSLSIGFPKRPKGKSGEGRSANSQDEMPDRLHRSKLQLKHQMLPSIDWPGLSVKYYLDFNVTFGQDEFRARIPITLI